MNFLKKIPVGGWGQALGGEPQVRLEGRAPPDRTIGMNHCQSALDEEEYRLTVLGDASTILRFFRAVSSDGRASPF